MIIQMSDLDDEKFGRFGNQLFKFFFLKIVEQEIDCEIRYPNWLGTLAFNLPNSKDLESTADLIVIPPNKNYSLQIALQMIRNKIITGSKLIELRGFFQFHTSEYSKYKNLFFETFKINTIISNQIIESLNKVNLIRDNIISIHIRRGDYTNYAENEFFWLTSMNSIYEGIANFKIANFKNRLIYICSDDLVFCQNEFKNHNYDYITSDNLFAYENENLRLLVDFYMMIISNANFISNSSLSFFASMLNVNSRIFLRPSPNKNFLIPYDPWNSQILLSKHI